MPLQQFDERVPWITTSKLQSTDTPGANFSLGVGLSGDNRVDIWQVSSDDTVDHTLSVGWLTGASFTLIGGIAIPAGSGFGALPPIDVLAAIMPAAFHYLVLPAGADLYIVLGEAISAGKFIWITNAGGMF